MYSRHLCLACWMTIVLLTGAGLLVTSVVGAEPESAQIRMETTAYERNEEAFARCAERLRELHPRNLLARREANVEVEPPGSVPNVFELADGEAGSLGNHGRVMVNGQPTVISYYLGSPKPVTEVGVFSYNIDTRANQDFEVRFADNRTQPGVVPEFPDDPDLTSGPTILGADSGGFHTRFVRGDGKPLTSAPVDWVQFRIWRTHQGRAGEPAKTRTPGGATALIELEVLGAADDALVLTEDDLRYRAALRTAAAEPEAVVRDDPFQSVVASFEAALSWECGQDSLALRRLGIEFGPWHVLGPIAGRETLLKPLREAPHIDLAAPLTTDGGESIAWRAQPGWKDWQAVEVPSDDAGGRREVILLCRDLKVRRPVAQRAFSLAVSADRGVLTLLPEKKRLSVRSPFGLVSGGQELELPPGDYQCLLELKPGDDGVARFAFLPQPSLSRPGAGDANARRNRRQRLCDQIGNRFAEAEGQRQLKWELNDEIWLTRSKGAEYWLPGHVEPFLRPRYAAVIRRRLDQLEGQLAETAGVRAESLTEFRSSIGQRVEALRNDPYAERSFDNLREFHADLALWDVAIDVSGRVRSLQLSIDDQRETFADRYPQGEDFQRRAAELEARVRANWQRFLAGEAEAGQAWLTLSGELDRAGREILLANPLLDFDRLLIVKGGPGFASNWSGPNRLGNELAILSPVSSDGQLTTVHQGNISDYDLHWDGQRILFSDGRTLWEIRTDGSELRRVSAEEPPITHYDACYLPDGKVLCVSNACEQAVPCTGQADVGNLHLMNADGTDERRVSFDQDHNWNPTVMHDGRVLYSRWEYTDTPHYFSRLLFRMNPDGTGQMEYYGSNSYWPNSTYWPRPIPGHPTMISCIVSGHHGVSRAGEILLLDPARGRHEAAGAVQRIPGYGKPVEAITMDQLVSDVWPRFAAPWPLAEPETHRGAGKYFLACVQHDAGSSWDLCLVDIFDNITPILTGGYMTPVPLLPRPMPPVIPSRVDPSSDDAMIYLADVYAGPGLRGFPPGSIKRLRIGTHHYRYPGNGDTRASSLEGGWDVKRILGTVPVHEDGSALFRVPANTPIFVQPLDAEGKAQQVMRSWYTAMPGEVGSCIGCHERQNEGPASKYSMAAIGRRPSAIEPWLGPTRGFSFDREIQPVLDRRCAGCHHGQPVQIGDQTLTAFDLRAKRLVWPDEDDSPSARAKTRDPQPREYSPAYIALQQYVRRPGFEGDYHMPKPAEYEAETSMLVQLLKKGHYNVQLTGEEWERLYAWIDYNVPYPANWRESHRPPTDEQVARRALYKQMFANLDDRDEDPLPLPPVGQFEPPAPLPPLVAAPQIENWPFTAEQAAAMQQAIGLPTEFQLELGDGVTMPLALIPPGRFVMGQPDGFADESPASVVTIDQPFYLGRFEVTNQQFAQFDPQHNSGVINERWKDRSRRGTPIDQPDAPVVRITWLQAMAFCDWLSEQTGRRCLLPSESQWEWACRAGTDTPFHAGAYEPGMTALANIADETARRWNHGRAENGYQDGRHFTGPGGGFAANAWGLHDMHGNVAEWCSTVYRAYPYRAADGRDNLDAAGPRVVRGGSWNDTLRFATSASRWRYEPYKPVYNVGFRVLVEVPVSGQVALQ